MKIAKLELENVKRVKAVEIEPAANGLTVIGGKNGQGKTSVLDAIAWALGGEKYRPSSPQRDGSVLMPKLHIVLDNGIVVDREGKNSALKVTDPSGKRAGQQLLDSFIEKLALDLPKFLSQTSKEKASTLLKVIGMDEEIKKLDNEENAAYNRRHAIGQIADQKVKYADEMQDFPGVPMEPVSVSELIEQQQAILLKNAENQKKRERVKELESELNKSAEKAGEIQAKIYALQSELEDVVKKGKEISDDLVIAAKSAEELRDESTTELEESIRQIDDLNMKIRANLDKEKALQEAREIRAQYDALTKEINEIRQKRINLLNSANLPLPDLSVENGELIYKGKGWDCMSSSEQMMVSVAIIRALNPNCGFVLLDKMEQMDQDTLKEFDEWMTAEGLQGICTRVSTGEECEIIIEDGVSRSNRKAVTIKEESQKAWKEGEF